MLVHIVFWKLQATPDGRSAAENALELKRLFDNVRGRIPGLLTCEIGIDISRTAESSDVALYSEFESPAALEAYNVHPLHQEIVGFLKRVRTERRVVDFEK
jgi:hypothetical protein